MKPRYKGAHRSGLEDKIAKHLKENNIPYEYEKLRLAYVKWTCPHCKLPVTQNYYTPDFTFDKKDGTKLIIEAKGRFTAEDRTKMVSVKRDNPLSDIRLVFQRDQPIRKGSKTTYSLWAKKHGFPFAFCLVPLTWCNE